MAPTLKQPTDRRGGAKLRAHLHRLSRRERIAAVAFANVLVLLLAAGVGSAVGGDLPLIEGSEEARGGSSLPSDWAGPDPLLPLAPSLKDIAALKTSASGEASGVLAAESGAGGALRVRALPEAAASTSGGTGAAKGPPSARPRSRDPSEPAPALVRRPSVRRILAARLGTFLGRTNELRRIVENDLRNLTSLPIDSRLDIDIPSLDPDAPSLPIEVDPLPTLPGDSPLPGGTPLPAEGSASGIAGGGASVNLTVADSQADSRFDVLLVARGPRLLEAYRFRDRDIAGLAAQINLRSSVLVADLLRDGERLARVTAAPLRPDTAGRGSGSLLRGPAAVASRSGTGTGAGPAGRPGARAGVGGRPPAGRRGRGSGGRSPGGGRTSAGSGSGANTPRAGAASRRSLRSRRSAPTSPSPRPKPKPRRGARHSKPSRPSRGRRSSGDHGRGRGRGHRSGHRNGHGKHDDV